jgi:hypothetical protein
MPVTELFIAFIGRQIMKIGDIEDYCSCIDYVGPLLNVLEKLS